MKFKIDTIAKAISLVYETPVYAIHGNPEAMDMLCLFTSMYNSKNKDVSAPRLGISEAMFAKRVRTAQNRLEYQNLLRTAEAIREQMDRISKIKTLTH